MTRLSPNFTLAELVKSQTAIRKNIPNKPTSSDLLNLEKLCLHILQPVRNHFKCPVFVTSGFRSPALSKAIGSTEKSQHCTGQAADFEVPNISTMNLALWIRENLDYDQLILEYYVPEEINSGWVHCSYVSKDENRKQALTYDGEQYGLL